MHAEETTLMIRIWIVVFCFAQIAKTRRLYRREKRTNTLSKCPSNNHLTHSLQPLECMMIITHHGRHDVRDEVLVKWDRMNEEKQEMGWQWHKNNFAITAVGDNSGQMFESRVIGRRMKVFLWYVYLIYCLTKCVSSTKSHHLSFSTTKATPLKQ